MGSWGISEQGWRKGPWTPEEDKLLIEYVKQYGEGRWSCVSKCAGLKRSGKSSRLRWVNYLRPGLKKGNITPQEEGIIIELHALWGNKWSTIARYLPGRTDNEIKNYWRTHFKKRKPSHLINQDKRNLFLKQKQEEESQENNTNAPLQSSTDNEKEDQKNLDASFEHRYQLLPMISQDSKFWSDFIAVDNDLWGGLWNPDDHSGCSKMANSMQNEPSFGTYSCEGDVDNYVQNGGFIF